MNVRVMTLLPLTLIVLAACRSEIPLIEDDLVALRKLRSLDSGRFRHDRVIVSPAAATAIEVQLEGQVTFDSPSGAELWIPLVLVKQYPSYIGRTFLNDSLPFQIESYRVENGLWCIIARLPQIRTLPRRPTRISLRFLAISPDFKQSAHFLLPTDEEDRLIELSIQLPPKSAFRSREIAIRSLESRKNTELARIPAAMGGGRPLLIGQIDAPAGTVLDLSSIQFAYPLDRAWIIILVFFAPIVLLSSLVLRKINEIPDPEKITSVFRQRMKELALRHPHAQTTPEGSDPKREIAENILYQAQLDLLTQQYKGLLRRSRWVPRFNLSLRASVALLIALLAIVILLVVFSTPLLGQTLTHPTPPIQRSAPVLGDVRIWVGLTDSAGRSPVTLHFYALSDNPAVLEADIEIRTVERVEIETISASSPAKILRHSHTSVLLRVPVSLFAQAAAIRAMQDTSIRIIWKRSKAYEGALEQGHRTTVTFNLVNANTERISSEGGAFYWFPFDTKQLSVPLNFDQGIVLGSIQIREPSGYIGIPEARPEFIKLHRERSNVVMGQDRAEVREFVSLAPKQSMRIRTLFRRRWLQRIILTIGQISLGLLAGYLLGRFAGHLSKTGGVILQTLGVLAPPLLIWKVVTDRYEHLPTILAGQGSSVFELAFLFSWLVYAVTAITLNLKSK